MREVHAQAIHAAGRGGAGEVALGDVVVDLRELLLRPARSAAPSSASVGQRAAAGTRGRRQAAAGAGPARSCAGCVSARSSACERVDSRRATQSGYARSKSRKRATGQRVRRRGHGAPVGLEAADGLQQRERLAAPAAASSPGGSATRSIRSTMSAGLDPPARGEERLAPRRAASCGRVRPQNSAARSLT